MLEATELNRSVTTFDRLVYVWSLIANRQANDGNKNHYSEEEILPVLTPTKKQKELGQQLNRPSCVHCFSSPFSSPCSWSWPPSLQLNLRPKRTWREQSSSTTPPRTRPSATPTVTPPSLLHTTTTTADCHTQLQHEDTSGWRHCPSNCLTDGLFNRGPFLQQLETITWKRQHLQKWDDTVKSGTRYNKI